MERRAIMFIGRVQGVGFRATAASVASGHAVTGWVRNEIGDTVRLEVQGEPDAIERMVTELRDRMKRHIIREFVSTLSIKHDEQGFMIRR